MDGRPEANALATYPSCLNARRHDLGNDARPRFAVMRVLRVRPATCALAYHGSFDNDTTGTSRCARGVGFAIAFWHIAKTARTFGSCCFVSAPRMR
eukprot:2917716-Lingulodinium_polyedra.AAC.1